MIQAQPARVVNLTPSKMMIFDLMPAAAPASPGFGI